MKKNYILFLMAFLCAFVSGFGQTTVSYDFSTGGATSGTLDANISFGSFKNNGTSNPALNGGQLRLYQNATKGGSIIIYASNDMIITSVIVHASGTTGPAGYDVDGSFVSNLVTSTTYTMNGLSATSSVEFFQKDGSSSNRIYIDSFEVTYMSTSTDTELNFASTTYTASEGDSMISLCVDIINESATPTTANVVLTSSSTPHITYSTTGVTFPANSSTSQCVTINIADNTDCFDATDYILEIQSVNGGSSASAGSDNKTTLSISDNDGTNGAIKTLSFETGDDWGYSGTGQLEDDFNKYNGTMSYEMNNNESIELDNVSLVGYTNVTLSVAYAATGVDGSDDLDLEISYDGGSTYTDTKLIDGSSNYNLNINTVGTVARNPVQANPYIVNIPSTETQIRIRFSDHYADGSDYYYVDDIILSGESCSTPMPEINILGNTTDIPDGNTAIATTDNTDFGDVLITTDTSSNTFTIQNTGTLDLDLTSVTSSNNSVFTISGTTSAIIAAGNSVTFTVTFAPSTIGTATSTITILSDDTDEATYTFNVEGNGIAIPSIILHSENPAVTATNLQADDNIENTPIYAFDLSVTNYEAELTAFNFTTSGTATNADINSLKAWYSTDATFNITDTNLDNITTTLGTGIHSFSGLSQTIANGNTGYIFITASLPCNATNGNTIIVNAITTADLTFTTGNKSGIAYPSGTHIITEVPPNNITNLTTVNCENNGVNLSWTDATGCYDNYLVVASTTSENAPTGNSFTANTTYGSGTTYENGYVVYQGSGTSTSISSLTNGTQYYYTVFTRNGSSWSSGVSVNCTPNIAYCDPSSWSSSDSEIEGVLLTGENNAIAFSSTNICTNTVQDNTSMSADLAEGNAYILTVEFGDCNDGTYYNGAGAVWIDWNQDGDFDDTGELIGTATINFSGSNINVDFTINVPSGQTLGNYRMRIIQDEGGTEAAIDPCTNPGYGTIADYTIEVITSCTPTHTFTSMLPTSGPEETEITVTGTGFTASTTANFDGINATVDFVDATTLIVHVPAGATTSTITLIETGCNLQTGIFTIIEAGGSCVSTSGSFSDLIISEVYDSESNNAWYMEVYNPTDATIDLLAGNYKIERYGDYTDTTPDRTIALTGTIAPYTVYTLRLGDSGNPCNTISFDQTLIAQGINESDKIILTKQDIALDTVYTPNNKGYSIYRDPTSTGPVSTYSASDWTTLNNETCTGLGIFNYTLSITSPLISAITDTSDCTLLDFSITATEGDTSTTGDLSYQWYYNDGVSTTWTAVTSTLPTGYTILGEAGNNLLIEGDTNSLSHLNSHQFYCEVTEAGSCKVTSNAEKTNANATTWNGTVWSHGAPDINTVAVIDGNYNTTINGSFSACTLLINAGKTLTITSNEYTEIYFEVTNNGIFNIENNGSLVQIDDDAINTGKISMKRTTAIKKLDYVYWSSPVTGFNVNAISPDTPTSRIYKWNATAYNYYLTQGDWESAAGDTMAAGMGYIVRGPNSYDTTTTSYTANFNNGVPHNGVYNVSVLRGLNLSLDFNDDDWNLLGNPYPSAISADAFLLDPVNAASLDGFINIWTHGTLPTDTILSPFYELFGINYTADDYITYNASGTSSGPGTFDGYIAAGQAFMVNTVDSPLIISLNTTLNAQFNNSMRDKVHDNTQFYRTATQSTAVSKHRIWLDLTPQNGTTTRILTGYIDGATDDRDRIYDAVVDQQNFYSTINDEAFVIQGKGLPFVDTDTIPLGVNLTESGSHTISIAAVDGLFETENQNIYIKDNLTHLTFNITNTPYIFTSEAGIFNERFEIVFRQESLTLKDHMLTIKDIKITELSNGNVQFSVASNVTIKTIQIIDIVGRTLYQLQGNSNSEIYTLLALSNATYIAKVTLSNGQIISKKAVKRY
ncbi:choice-of-anchor D domain-containing protein [Lacinutrix undariae]